MKRQFSPVIFFLLFFWAAAAAAGGHGGYHGHEPAATPDALQILPQMPSSGRAREAGFDGRYGMESMSEDVTAGHRCALASRGIILLDRVSWKKCGFKGADESVESGESAAHAGHHQH